LVAAAISWLAFEGNVLDSNDHSALTQAASFGSMFLCTTQHLLKKVVGE